MLGTPYVSFPQKLHDFSKIRLRRQLGTKRPNVQSKSINESYILEYIRENIVRMETFFSTYIFVGNIVVHISGTIFSTKENSIRLC